MTLELTLEPHGQASKKKSKKDRKISDDGKRKDRAIDVLSQPDLAVDEGEERKRKRKEKKREREREGAIDGALPFSLALQER